MDKLSIRNFGPIGAAEIEISDFTLLIGPQASGKSFLLQLYKLIKDRNSILETLKAYGYKLSGIGDLMAAYLGEGMEGAWTDQTYVALNGIEITAQTLLSPQSSNETYKVIYIPAQRVMVTPNGWPRPFGDFGNDPYVLKSFSEFIRGFLEIGAGSQLFEHEDNPLLRDDMYRNVFYGSKLELDHSIRKRFILNTSGTRLPFMMWSSGQKEFISLWLSTYLLLHPSFRKEASGLTTVLEEPEMGLHPQAVKEVILEIMELMDTGYKIIVSTHSSMFLEFAWAVKMFKEHHAKPQAMYELFEKDESTKWNGIFSNILDNKKFGAWYFDNEDGMKTAVKDISSLDVFSEDRYVSEWGGLSGFSSRASEIVAKTVSL